VAGEEQPSELRATQQPPIPYDPDVPLALPKSGLIVRAKGAPPLDSDISFSSQVAPFGTREAEIWVTVLDLSF
jgi:hypothetical protein